MFPIILWLCTRPIIALLLVPMRREPCFPLTAEYAFTVCILSANTNACLQAAGGITGCTVSATAPDNSGSAFNVNGGGVYAMEWTSTAIRIWFFPRNAIPDSITSGEPDTDSFGRSAANFEGNCDIDAHFFNHSIVFNIDFCGQYAGNVWQANGCPMLEATNVCKTTLRCWRLRKNTDKLLGLVILQPVCCAQSSRFRGDLLGGQLP